MKNKSDAAMNASSRMFSYNKIFFVVGLLIIVGGCGSIVCYVLSDIGLSMINVNTYSGEEARSSIERVIGTTLPFDAENFEFYSISWMDGESKVRFTVPAAKLDLILTQAELCFTLPLEANGERAVRGNGSSLKWWTPDSAQIYLSGACGTNPYQHILVDTTDATVWTVYLNIFST